MEYHFLFQFLDSSDSLKDYARSKMDDTLKRLDLQPRRVQMNFCRRGQENLVQCYYHGRNGVTIRAGQRAGSPYEGVDLLMDKFFRQLLRRKERLSSPQALSA